LTGWASIELADYASDSSTRDNVLVDDVKKMNSLLKVVDRKQAYVLRENAIQTYVRDTDYDGLRDLLNFRQDDIFPFHNEQIQASYDQFCKDAENFLSDFFHLYTSDGRDRMTWRSADQRWLPQPEYDEVMAKIANLDRQASGLSKFWEALIVLAKQELKGATLGIDRYE
jgi:hypothetical protein